MDKLSKNKLQCPISISWPIKERSLRNMKYTNICSSPYYTPEINGIEYYLTIYPNGDTKEHAGQTWIYLYVHNYQQMKLKINFKIEIESANFVVETEQVLKADGEREEFGIFCCTTGELFDSRKKFICNEKVIIKMDGILTVLNDEEHDKKWKCNHDSSFLGLNLWKQESTKDFTIVAASGRSITVHKCVLATQSTFFKKMIESERKEAQKNKFKISDYSFQLIEAAVKLCYHHSLVTDTTIKNKLKLLQFFDKYGFESLKNELEEYLITEITESNVCRLINSSIISNSVKLQSKCSDFLRKCLQQNKNKTIHEFDLLNKDFAFDFLKNLFHL